jgi:hypothetical protein
LGQTKQLQKGILLLDIWENLNMIGPFNDIKVLLILLGETTQLCFCILLLIKMTQYLEFDVDQSSFHSPQRGRGWGW